MDVIDPSFIGVELGELSLLKEVGIKVIREALTGCYCAPIPRVARTKGDTAQKTLAKISVLNEHPIHLKLPIGDEGLCLDREAIRQYDSLFCEDLELVLDCLLGLSLGSFSCLRLFPRDDHLCLLQSNCVKEARYTASGE